jgi:hypothetical protein
LAEGREVVTVLHRQRPAAWMLKPETPRAMKRPTPADLQNPRVGGTGRLIGARSLEY